MSPWRQGMRLRICRRLQRSIDRVAIDRFQIGLVSEIGTELANVLLADGSAEHSPDRVLLDLNMPVMDGWQFPAEQRRLVEPDLVKIPVLIVTGADGADR